MDSSIDIEEILALDPLDVTRPVVEAVIAAWRAKEAERLAADKEAAKLKAEEVAMKSWLISVFLQQKFEGIVLNGRITGLSTKEVHAVEDRAAFIDYIYEQRAIDMLQFRLSDNAIFGREEMGFEIPGVRREEVHGLFDRKA